VKHHLYLDTPQKTNTTPTNVRRRSRRTSEALMILVHVTVVVIKHKADNMKINDRDISKIPR